MFDVKRSVLIENKIIQYQILKDNELLSFNNVIQFWKIDDAFNDFFNEILANAEFVAFFWEVPPITLIDLNLPFEFVLLKSNLLANLSADEKTFHNHFSVDEAIVTFPNLRGDAQLIVPAPISEYNNYPHIARFIRNAPVEQKRALWKTVAQVYENKLGLQPIWLSTAGLGVSWLHIRIDSKPKYYRHRAYKAKNYLSSEIL